MTKFRITPIWRAALCALAMTGAATATLADTVRVGGTGAALGGMNLLARAYEAAHPGTTVTVLPSLGSGGGIKALSAGAIDVSVSSRPLKDKEKASGVLQARRYARTPLAIVTAPSNSVDAITSEQLHAAYAGTMLNWPDGSRIRILLRPATETDTKLMRDFSPEMATAVDAAFARPGILTAQNDQQNAETLEETAGSLGVVALAQLVSEKRKLKVLAFDGVTPRAAMAADPAFLFAKNLYIIARSDASSAVRGFLDFVKSTDGRRVLDENAHFTFD
jgi:phosphate transport system substrate-binding protein